MKDLRKKLMHVQVGLPCPWHADKNHLASLPESLAGVEYGLLVAGTLDDQRYVGNGRCIFNGYRRKDGVR